MIEDLIAARDLLTEIRCGMTLAEACELEGMPSRLTVYDWLRDPTLMLDESTFSQLYKQACQDRTLTWQDEAARVYDDLTLTGDPRVDSMTVKIAADKANLLLRIAKDQRETIKISTPGGDTINVSITTYEPPQFEE